MTAKTSILRLFLACLLAASLWPGQAIAAESIEASPAAVRGGNGTPFLLIQREPALNDYFSELETHLGALEAIPDFGSGLRSYLQEAFREPAQSDARELARRVFQDALQDPASVSQAVARLRKLAPGELASEYAVRMRALRLRLENEISAQARRSLSGDLRRFPTREFGGVLVLRSAAARSASAAGPLFDAQGKPFLVGVESEFVQ